jgi:hypothetical protein
MNIVNGADTSSPAVPTPAELIALIKRINALGNRSATISAVAKEIGVQRPTLIRWARQGRAFGPEHLSAAAELEVRLRLALAEAEASEKAKDSASARSEGEPEKAVSEAPEAATAEENVAVDSDAEWTRRQREYGGTAGAEGVGETFGRETARMALKARFERQLARLRAASPRPASAVRGLIPMPGGGGLIFDTTCTEPTVLPPRVTDRHIRGNVSVLVADPNTGKSQLFSATAMAIAYEALSPGLGQKQDGWPGAALVVSNEEDPGYVRARWRVQQQGLPPPAGHHQLVVWEKHLTLARFEDSFLIPTEDCCVFVERLADWAEQDVRFAHIAFDPLSTLFEGFRENDAAAGGDAIRFLKRIAEATFAAVDVAHHTSKATRGQETVTAYRGSTGIEAASDEMSTLIILPDDEHNALGFPPDKAGRILRLKGVRARGPFAGTHYFEREIVNVVCEDARFPGRAVAGSVAILTPVPPPPKPGVSLDDAHRWLWEANQGAGEKRLTRGQRNKGKAGAAAQIIMRKSGCDRKAAENALDDLEKQGRVKIKEVWVSRNLRTIVIPEPPQATEDENEVPF